MTIATGSTAPAVVLPDAAKGANYDLTEALQRGPVIVSIYKSSCEASKTMFRMLEQIYQAYPQDELTVWGVAQDSPNVTRSFIRRIGVSFPILVEGNDYPISHAYDIEATPTGFLIDPSGEIVWQEMGYQKAAIEELSEKVAGLLGTKPADIFAGVDDIPGWVPG